MKQILSILILIALTFTGWSQNGFTAVTDMHAVKKQFADKMAQTQSLESHFTQTKQMKLLKENIVSNGKFYYKKDNKVRIDYQSPYNYLVILNNGQMSITDNYGKKTTMNTRNSKSLQSINKVMIDCMSGNIFTNNDFRLSASKNNRDYHIEMTPNTSELKSMFKKIDVYFNQDNLYINKMVITELNGDITDMKYSNVKANTGLNDQLFKTK